MKIALDAPTIKGFVEQFLLDGYEDREPIPNFHVDWWNYFTGPDKNVMIAAPRGHAKSTALNHAYGLAIGLFQNHPFQFKVSRTYDLAVEKLQQAKETLVNNEKIKHIFGFRNLERDTENDFIAVFNDGYRMRMFALGMEQKVRGKSWGTTRPTAILCDDMEDDEQVESVKRRDKSMNWFMRVLMPIGGRHTISRVVGTILHEDAILMRLQKMEDWKCYVYEACDGEITPASVLWPTMFPVERLAKIKRTYVQAGDLPGFNMEFRNKSGDRSSGLFREEDFRPMPESVDRKKLTYYVGMDFAISEDQRRDYTVIVVAGMDTDGMLYVVDVQRGHWEDGNEIIDQMFLIERAYHPAEWFAESGMISKALGAALELRMREGNDGTGLYLNITPMVPLKSKRARAANIRARVRGKGVCFDRDASWFPEFEEELLQFDRATHDDQVDAFAHIGMGLANMTTPLTMEEEDEIELETARRESMSFGRSSVTGY